MGRVAGRSIESLGEDLSTLCRKFSGEYGEFTNQIEVFARSPEAARHLYGLLAAWREKSRLPRRLVEIAVLTASRVNQCSYCVGHHGAAVVDLGVGSDSAERILDPNPPGLDEEELLVRDYARLVTERPWGIRDGFFDDLRRHFDDDQIVELTVRIGVTNLFNKVNDALQIDIEESVLTDMMSKNIRKDANGSEDSQQ